MNRREALKSIGVASALPLVSRELVALGRAVHAQVEANHDGVRYVFLNLDAEESENLAAATELILPETHTPGARSAKVPEFIDAVLGGWFSDDERHRFLRGLRALDDKARSAEGAGFSACASAAQIRILEEMEAEALRSLEGTETTRQARRGALTGPGAPFFSVLKWLTLFGYYTSEVGMDKELEHVDFPGSYDGCALLRSK